MRGGQDVRRGGSNGRMDRVSRRVPFQDFRNAVLRPDALATRVGGHVRPGKRIRDGSVFQGEPLQVLFQASLRRFASGH